MDRERKAAVARRLFGIPSIEQFLDVFECVFKKSWIRNGRLWVFSQHICFYSNIFGSEQKILIRSQNIVSVQSSKAMGVVGASLEIQTQKHMLRFSGFSTKERRDTCIQLISQIIAQHSSHSIGSNSSQSSEARANALRESVNALQSPNNNNNDIPGVQHESDMEYDSDGEESNIQSPLPPKRNLINENEQLTQKNNNGNDMAITNVDTEHHRTSSDPTTNASSPQKINNIVPHSTHTSPKKRGLSTTAAINSLLLKTQSDETILTSNENLKITDHQSSPSSKYKHKNGINTNLKGARHKSSLEYIDIQHSYFATGSTPASNINNYNYNNININNIDTIQPQINTENNDNYNENDFILSQRKDNFIIGTKGIVTLENNFNDSLQSNHSNSQSTSGRNRSFSDPGSVGDLLSPKQELKITKSNNQNGGKSFIQHLRALGKPNSDINSKSPSSIKSPITPITPISPNSPKLPKSKLARKERDSMTLPIHEIDESSDLSNLSKQHKHKKRHHRGRRTKKLKDNTSLLNGPNKMDNINKIDEIGESNDENLNLDVKSPSSALQFIDEKYNDAQIADSKGNESLKWELIGEAILNTLPIILFDKVINSFEFNMEMHNFREDSNVTMGEWNVDHENNDETMRLKENQPITYSRKANWITKVKDPPPFVADKTEVFETQRIRFYGSNRFVVDATVSTPNIKYGDHFFIIHKQIFTIINKNQTKVQAFMAFHWVKQTWFKKIIESKASSETKNGVADWLDCVKKMFPDSKQNMRGNGIEKESNIIDLNENGGQIGGRKIADSVIKFMHHEPTIWDIYVKPIWMLFLEILQFLLDRDIWCTVWNDLKLVIGSSRNNNDNNISGNIVILTRQHIILIIIVGLIFVLFWTIFLFLLWLWYNSSFYFTMKHSNHLLEQQSQLLISIVKQLEINTKILMTNRNLTTLIDSSNVTQFEFVEAFDDGIGSVTQN